MRVLKQSDTSKKLVFLLVSSSDHITPVTGATPTVMISKNGSQFTSPSGTVSEVGHGWYALTPSSNDMDTLGPLLLHAEAEGADPVDVEYQIVSYDPYDGDSLGLARLDAAVSTRVAVTDERLDRLDVAVSTRLSSTDSRLSYLDTAVSSRLAANDARLSYLDAAISSRATAPAVWQYSTRTLTESVGIDMSQPLPTQPTPGTVGDALSAAATRLDAAVSTRLASGDYVPPDNATLAAIYEQVEPLQYDEQGRVLAQAITELDPAAIAAAVWDANREDHNRSGTFGAVTEWAGAAGVVVQPLTARVFTAVGDGGVITLWRHARVRASWHVDADLTGHDIRWIIYRALEPSIVVREIRGDVITIEPQPVGCLITVDGPDDLVPAPGEYRYVLRDQTVDAVLLAGRCVVMDAPDAT